MSEVMWQEISKADKIVTKRQEFKTAEAMERFIEKLVEKDSFYKILATR